MKGEREGSRLSRPKFEALEPRLLLNGTIEGQIWDDLNANGIHDPDEPGLSGVTVELVSAIDGSVVASTVSASVDVDGNGTIDPATEAGLYDFSSVVAGSYEVRQDVTPGRQQLTPVPTMVGASLAQTIGSDDPGIVGLENPEGLSVSPDGRSVYVTAWNQSYTRSGLTIFGRNPTTGELTLVQEAFFDVSNALEAPRGVAVSPDGGHVYVAGSGESALGVYERDPIDGVISLVQVLRNGEGGVVGLNGCWDVAISQDGNHVYAAGPGDGAVCVFDRDVSTGALTQTQVLVNGVDFVSFLDSPKDMTLSEDGLSLYVVNQSGTLGVFQRDVATGLLTYRQDFSHNYDGVIGLINPRQTAVSRDGRYAYVASFGSGSQYDYNSSVDLFARDVATGDLTYVRSYVEDGDASTVDGLDGALWLAVSPDNQGLIVGGKQGLTLFARNVSTGELTHDSLLSSPRSDGGAFSPDSGHLYMFALSDSVTVMSLQSQVGSWVFDLGDGDVRTGVDFVNVVATNRISGRLVGDENNNGLADVDEAGLDGWRVELSDTTNNYLIASATTGSVDLNGDGTIDPETETGLYEFLAVLPGDYEIRPIVPATWTQTSPAGPVTVSLAPGGASASDVDFAMFAPSAISGQVFGDHNGDGVMAVGESGLDDWTVELIDPADGSVLATANTVSGVYRFDDLLAGDYRVQQVLPSGWTLTTPDEAHDVALDFNEHVAGLTFGNIAYGTLAGQVWDDLDGDGVHDVGEPGVDGWTVELLDVAAGVVVDTQTTSSVDLDGDGAIDPQTEAGLYSFANVAIGWYEVQQVLQPGWQQARQPIPTGEFDFVGSVIYDGSNGLHGARASCLSNDGKHLYVASSREDALAVFALDPVTGWPTFVQALRDGVDGVDGLDMAYSITLSSDGRHVYVAGPTDDAIAVFARDAVTGELSFIQHVRNGVDGVVGLGLVRDIVLSNDGQNVYAAAEGDHALAVFARDVVTGELTFIQVLRDDADGMDGLSYANAIAISGDDAHVYVGAGADDSVTVFARDAATGELSFVQILKEPPDSYANANAIVVSPDGDHVYAATTAEDAISVFSRNAGTGELTFVEKITEGRWLRSIRSMTTTADGRFVYLASYYYDYVVAYARNRATGELSYVHSLSGSTYNLDEPSSVTVSDDGAHIYVTSGPYGSGSNVTLFSSFFAPGPISLEMAGDDISGVDLGVANPVTVGGQLFNDADNDGQRDAAEVGINGWTVELVATPTGEIVATDTTAAIDLDSDGTIDPITEAGRYVFADVWPGDYELHLVVAEGFTQTTPIGPHSLPLVSGDADQADIDFGAFLSNPAEVHGQVVDDLNGNRVRDAGEPGFDGRAVELISEATGDVVATTTTASVDVDGNGVIDPMTEAGLYSFTNVVPGDYQVRQAGSGFVQTWPEPEGMELAIGDVRSSSVGLAVAMSADASFVVAWSDGTAQRYDASGAPVGDEIVYNDEPAFDTRYPRVAANASGEFVIAWYSSDRDGDGYGVFARMFDASGQAKGASFQVNDTTANGQYYARVAMADNGQFVIAWQDAEVAATPGEPGVVAKIFDAFGAATTGEILVYNDVYDGHLHHELAMNNDGRFVVAWNTYAASAYRCKVNARLFDGEGNPLTSTFRVDQGYAGDAEMGVGMDDAGRFVITWGGDEPDKPVLYRQYSADAVPLSGPIALIPEPGSTYRDPAAAMAGDGSFILAFRDTRNSGAGRIIAQAFDADGTTTEGSFVVTEGTSQHARVVVNNRSDFLVAYSQYVGSQQWQVNGTLYSSAARAGGYYLTVEADGTATGEFGNVRPVSEISGQVFYDADNDGQHDATEIGLNGCIVELADSTTGYILYTAVASPVDVNGDGVIDPVAEGGQYVFSDIWPGNYVLRVRAQEGYATTLPVGGIYALSLLQGGPAQTGLDLGVFTPPAEVHGQAFDDLDRNGTHGADEPGVDGWTMELVEVATGLTLATTVTASLDANGDGVIDPLTEVGLYEFVGMPPGSYEVHQVERPGWQQTYATDLQPGALESVGIVKYREGVDEDLAEIAASPDGLFLYVVSREGMLVVFSRDPLTGEVTIEQELQDDETHSLAFANTLAISPDGRHIYVASDPDDTLSVYSRDLRTGLVTLAIAPETFAFPRDLIFSSDGAYAYAASAHNNGVMMVLSRDADTGRLALMQSLQNGVDGVSGLRYPTYIVMSSDGTNVYVEDADTGDITILARDVVTGELEFRSVLVDTAGRAQSMAMSPDGRFLYVTRHSSVQVHGRDLATGELTLLYSYDREQVGEVGDINITADGRRLVMMCKGGRVAELARDELTGELTLLGVTVIPLNGKQLSLMRWESVFAPGETHLYAVGGGYNYDEAWGSVLACRYDRTVPAPLKIDLVAGQVTSLVDFGNMQLSSIFGQVFGDGNNNGLRDLGEVGVDGWGVEVFDATNGFIAAMPVTRSMDLNADGVIDPATESGLYSYDALPSGDYVLRPVVQGDWAQTFPASPRTVSLDRSDATDLDFGVFKPNRVSGQVFADRHADGANDAGDLGQDGWTVELIDAATGAVLATTTTASVDLNGDGKIALDSETGLYAFDNLIAGDYQIRQVARFGWMMTAPVTSIYSVSLTIGENVVDLDFGNYGLGDIEGQVFEDMDGNAGQDTDEPGMNGWTIELVDAATGDVVATAVTASIDLDGNGLIDPATESGWYSFASVPVAQYLVREQARPGYLQTLPVGPYEASLEEDDCFYPNVLTFSFTNEWFPSDGGVLTIEAYADLDASFEYLVLEAEGTFLSDLWLVGGQNMAWVTTSIKLSKAQLADWASDGETVFTVTPTGGVDGGYDTELRLTLSYPGFGGHAVVVAANETIADVDFGVFAPASAAGQVFADLNYDSLRDVDEDGLNGWTVELVDAGSGIVVDTAVTADVDVDGDGSIDPHAESGLYAFAGVLPGDHEIRLVLPELWSQTYPAGGVPQSYLPLSGYTQIGLDFGVASLPSIAGQVFYDSDGNGLHDGDENGLNGWTVELVDPTTGDVLATAVTVSRDIDGNSVIDPIEERGTYRFTDLLPGTYLVRQIAQNGWIQTAPGTTTYTYTIDITQHETEGDFGNYQPSSVSGQKWHDVNADGHRDDGEVGLSGWTIELVDAATGLVVATTVTADVDLNTDGVIDPMAEAGLYTFIDLPAGDYELREVQQGGWVQSWIEPLDVTLRVSFAATSPAPPYDLETFTYYPYWLEGSHVDFNRDPGLWKVNDDVYANGTLDRYNMPQYAPGADPNVYWFIFEDVRIGEDYWQAAGDKDFNDFDIEVVEDHVNGVITLTGYRRDSMYAFRIVEPNGTIHTESDSQIGPITLDNSPIYGAHPWVFSLANDQSLGDLYFSNFQGGGEVTGRHFNDINANGVRDDGETGLDGWTVEGVDPVSGRVVDWAVTTSVDLDGNGTIDPATETGLYSLASMPAGTFDIRLVVPPGWVQTSPFGDTHSVTLVAGEAQAGFDFAAAELGIVSGQLFNDVDSSGGQDAGEFGINGWTVELVDTDTSLVVGTTTTGGVDDNGDGVIDPQTEAGRYAFTGLPAGNYETRVTAPTGWTQTSPIGDLIGRLFAVRGSGTSMTIYEIDPADGSVLNSFLAPPTATAGLQGLAVGPDSLFYLDAGDMTAEPVLWELNLDTGAVIDSDSVPVAIPAMAMGLAWLDGEVYIQSALGEITVFDPATDTVTRTLSIPGNAAGGLAASAELGVLFACNSASEILTIDPATGAILDTFTLGVGSLFGGLAYCDGELLASNMLLDVAGTVHRIDPVTGDVLGTLSLAGEGSTMGGLGGDYDPPAGPAWRQIALAADEQAGGADYGYHGSNAPGDMDGDGDVDVDDIDLLFADFGDAGHAGPQSDLDGDGDADSGDMDILVHDLVETTVGVGTEYGDTNLDGMVDSTDLTRLATHFAHFGVGWDGGDLNGSGLVNITDLVILAAYYGFGTQPPGGGDSLSASAAATLGAPPATQSSQPDLQATSETAAQMPAPVTEPLSAGPPIVPVEPLYANSPGQLLAAPVSEVVAPAATGAAPEGPVREPDGQLPLRANVNDVRAKRGRRLGRADLPAPTVMALAPSDAPTTRRRGRAERMRAQVAVGVTVPARQSARRQRQDESFEDEFSVLDVDPLMKVTV